MMMDKKSLMFLFVLFLSTNLYADDLGISEEPYSLANRVEQERQAENLRYVFVAHKPSFIFPLSYSFDPNPNGNGTLDNVDNAEVKFQFSFKLNIVENFFDHFKLAFGYTNLSFWQLYNKQDSAAFRETNHEPELFFTYNPAGWSSEDTRLIYRLGFVHQSNGKDVELSRSWNRFYIEAVKDLQYTLASLKVWHRVKEKAKKNPNDSEGDDNPDIRDFLGNFELRLTSRYHSNIWSVLLRNNLKPSNNKGAVEITTSLPLRDNLRIYVQYFKGYGDSLIDYNYSIERFSLGFAITDWI